MKKHFKPEFQLICCKKANSKFFVASGIETPSPIEPTHPAGHVGATYSAGSGDGSNDVVF